jgi:hypothetical protein
MAELRAQMNRAALAITIMLAMMCIVLYYLASEPPVEPEKLRPPPIVRTEVEPGKDEGMVVEFEIWTNERVQAFVREHENEIEKIDLETMRWREYTASRQPDGNWRCSRIRTRR